MSPWLADCFTTFKSDFCLFVFVVLRTLYLPGRLLVLLSYLHSKSVSLAFVVPYVYFFASLGEIFPFGGCDDLNPGPGTC